MNKILIYIITTLCLFEISHVGNAQSSGTLTIKASNFSRDSGKAVVNLFREADDIPKKPFMQSSSDIVNGKAVVTFQIPYGNYAAILFHDENSNQELDHKFGFPNEPMGFSNEWNLTLFSGMPSFNKLKFHFSDEKPAHNIKIK